MIRIAPSLLSADFANLASQIEAVEKSGADWLHLDVMDGHFVPNITFGPPVIKSLRRLTRLPFDTHLMIHNPDAHIEAFRDAGSDIITVHVETCPHLHRTLGKIRDVGAKPGVTLNPATPVSSIERVVELVDLILVMSVNPGFAGQAFIPQSLGKIREIAALIRTRKPTVFLEVDGGLDSTTIPSVVKAGANVLVAGKAIFGSRDIPKAMRALRSATSLV